MADEATPEKRIPKPIAIKAADKKADTARIDLNAAKPPSILDKSNLPPDADEFFKRSTMRIDTPPAADKKAETSRIDIPKRQTAKVDPVALPPDEAFKTKTAPVGIPVNPATARMKPKTLVMKRPGAAAPGESIVVSAESTAKATEQARKSETARIDLTAEDIDKPATRPKTIRIKRPDGTTGRKALAISRPEESDAPAVGASSPMLDNYSGEEDDEPGAFAGIMGIAALLVAGALFYVLLAQTFALDLPFPGRI